MPILQCEHPLVSTCTELLGADPWLMLCQRWSSPSRSRASSIEARPEHRTRPCGGRSPRSWIRSNSMPSMSELRISSWSVHPRSSRSSSGLGPGVGQGEHLDLRAAALGRLIRTFGLGRTS